MMLRLVIPLVLVAFSACAFPKRERPLTIAEAHRMAEIGRSKDIKVAGYFFYHFEGHSLEPSPGSSSVDGLPLRWNDRPTLVPLQHVRLFHGKYVELSGSLRKGAIFRANVGDVAWLDVKAINEANKAPEPTTTAVTSPAAQEPRQP